MADTREMLALVVCNATQKTNYKCEFDCEKKGKCAYCLIMAEQMIANGVTVTDNNVGGKWIPVTERLPKEHEYMAETQRGEQYYVRLLIAYMTDTVEYEIGYYDGWKWMTEMPIHIIKNVVAWKPFEPLPEPPKGE